MVLPTHCIIVIYVSLNGNSASLGPKFDGSCANNGTKTKIRFCGVICTEAIKVRPQWTTYWLRFHI